MAIRYKSFSITSAPVVNDLWQLIGGVPPADIELNTTNGAIGVNAPIPGNTNYRFQLLNSIPLLGVPGMVFRFENSTILQLLGVFDYGGNQSIIMAQNDITGELNAMGIVDSPTMFKMGSSSILNNRESACYQNPTERRVEIIDTNTGDATVLSNRLAEIVKEVYVAGGIELKETIDVNEWVLEDTVRRIFAVLKSGNIQTNQIQSPTGADVTIANRMPIYDTAGVLAGYVPIMVNP